MVNLLDPMWIVVGGGVGNIDAIYSKGVESPAFYFQQPCGCACFKNPRWAIVCRRLPVRKFIKEDFLLHITFLGLTSFLNDVSLYYFPLIISLLTAYQDDIKISLVNGRPFTHPL